MAHRKIVPEENIQEGDVVAIRCAHGDTVLYPLAKVSLEVEGRLIKTEAAVYDTLSMPVLLVADTPDLAELLRGDQKTEDVFAVVTRAAKRKQEAGAVRFNRQKHACGVQPKPADLEGPVNSDTVQEREEQVAETNRQERIRGVQPKLIDLEYPVDKEEEVLVDA